MDFVVKDPKQVQQSSSSSAGGSSNSSSSSSSSSSTSSVFNTGIDYNQDHGVFAKSTDVTDYLMTSSLFKDDRLYGFNFNKEISELMNNNQWLVDLDTDGDGTIEEGVKLVDAVAASFDSELDLYVQDKVNEVMRKLDCYDTTALFGSPDSPALKELAKLGIKVEAVGNAEKWQNRTYSFSLLDIPSDLKTGDIDELMKAMYGDGDTPPEDFKIIEDGNNKKASFIFSDCLIPDGICQGAEMNLSSILDCMGKECISKADFIDNEDAYFELMEKVDAAYNNGELTGDETLSDLYGTTMNICDSIYSLHHINGSAYGYWEGGFTSYEEGMARLAGRTPGMGMGAFKGYFGGSSSAAGSNVPSGESGSSGSSTNGVDANGNLTPAEQAKVNFENKQSYNKILDKLVYDYTKEKGSKPVGNDLRQLEREAKAEANISK